MKHKTFWAILSIFWVIAATHTLYAQNMSKSQMQQMYSNYLKTEGFAPDIDEDGDIRFKKEGKTHCIYVNEKDQQFFQMVYPNFWKIESDSERYAAALAASQVTLEKKIGKVYVTARDYVCISAELLLKSPADFSNFFYRLLDIVDSARDGFIAKMRTAQ